MRQARYSPRRDYVSPTQLTAWWNVAKWRSGQRYASLVPGHERPHTVVRPSRMARFRIALTCRDEVRCKLQYGASSVAQEGRLGTTESHARAVP